MMTLQDRKKAAGEQCDWIGGAPAAHVGSRALARTSDPPTSHAAAARVDTSRLETLVLEVIQRYGENGCISDQIVAKFPALPYSSVTGRYKPLCDKGLIRDSGRKRRGKTGRQQRVLVATEYL